MAAEIDRSMGRFRGHPSVPVLFHRSPVFLADCGVGQVPLVVDHGQYHLVRHKTLFDQVQGRGVRHLQHHDPGFFKFIGTLQDLSGAEGPVLRSVGLDIINRAGLPAPGMVYEKLRVDPEQFVEQILILQGIPCDIPHGKHAVASQFFCRPFAHTPEIGDGAMAPEFPAVAHLIQLGDPHAVGVRSRMFGLYIHGDLAEIEVGADARSGCDPGLLQNRPDHLHGKLVGGLFVEDQVPCHIHHDLVDGIDMDILRRDIAEIDFIDPGAVFDIMRHAGDSGDIVRLQGRIRRKLRRRAGTGGKGAVGSSFAGRLTAPGGLF